MREVFQPPPIVNFYDDLDLSERKTRVPAVRTVVIGWEGMTIELDLSLEHYKMVDDFMGPLLRAGRKVDVGGAEAPRHDLARGNYLRNLREWVREGNLKNKAGNGWAYETNTGTGHTYYPTWLLQKYDAFLAESDQVSA
jgi:Lsr2